MDSSQMGNYRIIGSLDHNKHDCRPSHNLMLEGRVVQCAECGQHYLGSADSFGHHWKKRSRRWVRRHFPEEARRG